VILGLATSLGPATASIPDATPPSIANMTPSPSVGLIRSGLLDLSRLELSHSLSFSVSSSSWGTHSGGLWLTRAAYRISDPLRLAVDVGAALDPMGDGPLLDENSFFLRGLELDYRPSKHFQLNISYVNLPAKAASTLYGRHGLGYRSWGSPLGLER
jgi:hypothetical protein